MNDGVTSFHLGKDLLDGIDHDIAVLRRDHMIAAFDDPLAVLDRGGEKLAGKLEYYPDDPASSRAAFGDPVGSF